MADEVSKSHLGLAEKRRALKRRRKEAKKKKRDRGRGAFPPKAALLSTTRFRARSYRG
jgi:hypothetical protein